MKDSKIPKFRRCVLQNFPFIEEDFDALTDYELLCKVVQYLNMVIDHQNNVDTTVEELNNSFIQLKSYVDNYFKNLDVQDEINTKLEEMADEGELAGIIAQFLAVAPVFAFDTASDMASAENLINGSIARTLGYSTIGDGKGAFYKIETRASQVIDGNVYIAVGDTLVAHKAVEYGYADTTNPIYYGADPTGTVDSAAAIQACIDANKGGAVVFTAGKYIVDSPINTPYYTDENVSINFNGATLYTEEALTYVLGIGCETHGSDMPNRDNYSTGRMGYAIFQNLVIDAVNAQIGIYTEQNYWLPKIFNTSIFGTIIGIKIGNNAAATWSGNAIIDKVYIQCKDYKNTSTRGIVINGHDNRFTALTICNAYVGIECNKEGNFFEDMIIYLYGHLNERNTQEFIETFPNTIGIVDNGGANKYIGVYVDTYGTMIKFGGSGSYYNGIFENCDYFTNTSGYNLTMFDFTNRQFGKLVIHDCQFQCFEPATVGGHIGLKISQYQRYDVMSRMMDISGNYTTYISQPDLLRIDNTITSVMPYLGSNTYQANKYYAVGYIPVDAYQSVNVRMTQTGSYKQVCRFSLDGSYNLTVSNLGTSGSDCGIGGKVVTYNGVHYIEVSVMIATNTGSIFGIEYDKGINIGGIGIIPALEPQIIDGTPIEVTPTVYTTFAS